jgi:hypothetical protein
MMLCACIASGCTITAKPTQATLKPEEPMTAYDFSTFLNVKITGVDCSVLTEDQFSVLYQAVR